MAAINAQALYSNVTTENYVRRVQNINPSKFTQSVLQISDQQSRDKNYEKSLEYIRTYIASLQAKINSLVEELNTIYENTLTETLFRRADSKNTAKKVNKLSDATGSSGDGVTNSLKEAGGRTDIVPFGYDGETRMFSYNPFFGTRSADLSNYYNLLANNDVSAARAYYQNADNTNHELGTSVLGTVGYLWLWDVDRITTSYATTMDKYVDQNGIMHLPTNDPLLIANGVTTGNYFPPKPVRANYPNDAAYNTALASWSPLIVSDPAMNIVGTNDPQAANKLQVNITALQPNRGIVDLSGIDAPKKVLPIPDLSVLGTYQAGDISYTNGSGYSFSKPPGNQLFFDTEKWAIVDSYGNTPKMEVITKVTLETPPVDSFGPNYSGDVPYGGLYGSSPESGWTNLTIHDNGSPRSIRGVGGQLWDSGGRTGQNGVHQVDLEKKITFVDDLLKYPSEPGAVYSGSGGGDDGYAVYIRDATGGTSSTGVVYDSGHPPGRPPVPSPPWQTVSGFAGPAGISYMNPNITATQEMYLHVTGNTSGWAGGSDGGAYIYGNFSISARTVGETVEVERYYVDENGNIFDRFGTGSNGSYGHFGGSSQVSNSDDPTPINNVANGYDDYNLFDYVPNITNPSLTSTASIPDITNGDFFYYREALNSNENTTNTNRPNITFDPRRTNVNGQLSITNNERVEIQNTDFAMFANTHLTYVEQNQDVFNQTKTNSFATWVGLSDKDLVANNEAKSNSEKDYLMKLNFENKDSNGTGILSAVTRVHVKAVGEPTIQTKITEEWDSVRWRDKPVKNDLIGGWQEDPSTPANPELTVSGTNFSVSPISTLVTPGTWVVDPNRNIYINEPWSSGVSKVPNLDVQPNVLTSINGSFTINDPGTYQVSGSDGDLLVKAQYFNGSNWVDIPGGDVCSHVDCTGTHSSWGGTYNFGMSAPPAFDGMQLRVVGTFDPGGPPSGDTFIFPLTGTMNLQASSERYVPPVYAPKTVTRDVESGSTSMAGYRDGQLKIYDTQANVPGANVERLVQYSTDGGNTWAILASNLPAGNPTVVDIPASVTGNVSFRAVTNIHAAASPDNTPAVNGVWNITKMEVVAQPIPENPKTLGLEMTKGYYLGEQQTGDGTIINPLSDTQAGYVKQDFYTGIDGVAAFNMYLNKDEYNALLRKDALVNDATLQVEIEYLEDTDQNGRIEGAELTNIKTRLLGVDDAARFAADQNRLLADTDTSHANTVYSNTLVASSGRTGGADANTQNENKFTKRLKQVIDSQEWQEVLKYGMLDNMYIAATASDNRGDQITGKLILNWDWQRRYIDVTQGSFTAIYKA